MYCRNPALEFVAAPALAPAEVAIDPILIKQYEDDLKKVTHLHFVVSYVLADSKCQAEGVPLPEEDDEL